LLGTGVPIPGRTVRQLVAQFIVGAAMAVRSTFIPSSSSAPREFIRATLASGSKINNLLGDNANTSFGCPLSCSTPPDTRVLRHTHISAVERPCRGPAASHILFVDLGKGRFVLLLRKQKVARTSEESAENLTVRQATGAFSSRRARRLRGFFA
jgi:hypothetical protein